MVLNGQFAFLGYWPFMEFHETYRPRNVSRQNIFFTEQVTKCRFHRKRSEAVGGPDMLRLSLSIG